MEKRIPFVQFQSVRSVAKAIEPYMRNKARLEAVLNNLDEEFKVKAEEELKKLKEKLKIQRANKKERTESEIERISGEIATIEAGIVSLIGFHVTDLVKKVIETDEKGVKVTKYLPTDIVTYDSITKEFVVTVPDDATAPEAPAEEPECPTHEAEDAVVPPTTESAGSDYYIDAQNNADEAEEAPDDNTMPWED